MTDPTPSSGHATCVAYAYIPYGHGGTDNNPICVLKSTVDLGTFKMQAFDLMSLSLGRAGR
jgi:hypothetical protein